MYETIIIVITGAMVAISSGLLGCYLVLRKMSMIADAITHAVLPGIVLAFLFSGNRDPFTMVLGAGILGLLTTFIIEFLYRNGNLQSDASIGITFTALFAFGVILISYYAGKVDLDQDCVLYGEIAYVPIDLWILDNGNVMGPRSTYLAGFVLIVVLFFITFFWKPLFITSFDPSFAISIGINTTLWHYLLMTLVSFTTVASFESVGAILVVALMITLPASAYLITDNLVKMMILTSIFGVLVSIIGYSIAYWWNGSIAGAMAMISGIIFMILFILRKYFYKVSLG